MSGRIHRHLTREMHRAFNLGDPSAGARAAWRRPDAANGHLLGNGRSANHGRRGRGIQQLAAPYERIGLEGLTPRQWFARVENLETSHMGHRYHEIGGHYSWWCTAGEAAGLVASGDPQYPSSYMLLREALMWAISAAPIEYWAKNGRLRFAGAGSRRAGLRSLPWSWGFRVDDLFWCRVLDIPHFDWRLPASPDVQLARKLSSQVAELWGQTDPTGFSHAHTVSEIRKLALGQKPDKSVLSKTLATLRIGGEMRMVMGKCVEGDEKGQVWSHLEGPRYGNNTAATWACKSWGPREDHQARVYLGHIGKEGWRRRTDPHARWPDPAKGYVSGDGFRVVAERRGKSADMLIPGWINRPELSVRLNVFHDRPAELIT